MVLPLLQDEVADWVTAEQFFTGLALVQVKPPPPVPNRVVPSDATGSTKSSIQYRRKVHCQSETRVSVE